MATPRQNVRIAIRIQPPPVPAPEATSFASVRALLAAHAATPLANASFWTVPSVDGSGSPLFGTVAAGALTPDPGASIGNRANAIFNAPRSVNRNVTLEFSPAFLDWL